MNRRGFLAAIPGLAALSRLWGKKEGAHAADALREQYVKHPENVACATAFDESGRTVLVETLWFNDGRRYRRVDAGPWEQIDYPYSLSNANRAVIAAGFPDDWRYWQVPDVARPTFAELSRQWDATT